MFRIGLEKNYKRLDSFLAPGVLTTLSAPSSIFTPEYNKALQNSTLYSTIAVRALFVISSNPRWKKNPFDFAQNGLYYVLHLGFGATACCLAYQSVTTFIAFWLALSLSKECSNYTKADCI